MSQARLVCRPLLSALLLLAALPAWTQSVGTKVIPRITFKPGVKTTVIAGTVSPPRTAGPDMTNEGAERYSLSARAGQSLRLEVSSPSHGIAFSLVKPSPGMVKYEMVERASAVKRWSGRLKMTGNYLVIVFTQDRKAASPFRLSVTLR